MNETLVTLVGNVATQPEARKSGSGAIAARFRLASSERRFDRGKGNWVDGPTSFYTVWAWRQLGENVLASVGIGEPLVVQGRLRVREDHDQDGKRRTAVEIDALAVGHDLTRGTSAFRKAGVGRAELAAPVALPVTGPVAGPVTTPATGPVIEPAAAEWDPESAPLVAVS